MQYKFVLSGVLASCIAWVAAQCPYNPNQTNPYDCYDIQSPPFNLVLISENSTLNGTTLSSAHEGAGIQAFWPGPTAPSTDWYAIFHLNSSAPSNSSIGEPGLLYWIFPDNPAEVVALGLEYGIISNVAMPLLGDGVQQMVAFDCEGFMNIQSMGDDRMSPPVPYWEPQVTMAYYRWYVCLTQYVTYLDWTLVWVIGALEPENPSCVKVEVQRRFV